MDPTADFSRCCLHCHATAGVLGGSLKTCGSCRKALFCSIECREKRAHSPFVPNPERADHKMHRIWCPQLTARDPRDYKPVTAQALQDLERYQAFAHDELIQAAPPDLDVFGTNPLQHSHFFVSRFEPRPDWRFGDDVRRRWKLAGAAAQPEAYVVQHIKWMQRPVSIPTMLAHLKSGAKPPEEGDVNYGGIELYKMDASEISDWHLSSVPFTIPARVLDPLGRLHALSLLEGCDDWYEILMEKLG